MSVATEEQSESRTVIVDGKELDAELAATVQEVRDIFSQLKKALKTIALYRHNTERFGEYLEPVYQALSAFLDRKQALQLRVDATSFFFQRIKVFEDDSRENNVIFPFWQSGIRLFIFKAGLSADELLRFLLLTLAPVEQMRQQEDIITRLWKSEFESIEYVVVEGFKTSPDEDGDEVEIQVEKVVSYLYRQLHSNSNDYLRFARISADDINLELNDVDQLRGVVIQGAVATEADKERVQRNLDDEEGRVLSKMVVVLFQLLELDTSEENYDEVADAFVQLLDALLLQEQFAAIRDMRERFILLEQKETLRPSTRTVVQRCAERFMGRMGEAQRLQIIAQTLNGGNSKDPDGVKSYLRALGTDAVGPLLEMLEVLELPLNRRLVAEVVVELGENSIPLLTQRLTHPSSNLVKEVLFIIDKLNPPQKFALFSHVLKHPNAVLRLETLALIGKNQSTECYEAIKRVFWEGSDAQMRAQAARLLVHHGVDKSLPILSAAVGSEAFEKRSDGEKKAIFAALSQIQVPEAQKILHGILASKSGIFSKKTDELKILAIGGLEASPSLPVLQLLAEVAKDSKKHSKEVCEVARAAAIQMKSKILGAAG